MLRVLAKAYLGAMKKDLPITFSRSPELTALCVTKIMGKKTKMQIISERLKGTGGDVGDGDKIIEKAKGERGRGMTAWANETEKPRATLEDFDLLKVIGRGSFGKVMVGYTILHMIICNPGLIVITT